MSTFNGGFTVFMKLIGFISLIISLILFSIASASYDMGNLNTEQYNSLAYIFGLLGVAAFCSALNKPTSNLWSKISLAFAYASWVLALIFGIMSSAAYNDDDQLENIVKYYNLGVNFAILSIGFFLGGVVIQ
tara:strand:- start:19907 stop:20302 length:396 start_codon:yes stop_codon:yes gene_type:complete